MKIEMQIDTSKMQEYLEGVQEQILQWPEQKRAEFLAHWEKMIAAGCENTQRSLADGRMVVDVSDDIRRAFADFGVVV